jgi:nicotinamidase-related amidase
VTNTAVVGLDYILDIVHPDGKVSHSAKSTTERGVTAAANQSRVIARPKDWLTVLVKLGFIRGYVDQPKGSPVFDRAQELGAVELDTPGTALHPDLDDSLAHRVITKPRVSGFYGTGLDETLRARRVERLIVAGFSSALTVQSTAREAHDPFLSLPAFIGDKKILLVLDNCEHVIDAAAALAERVVSQAPQTHILATSREALQVEGEHVHLLYSLDSPPEDAGLTAVEARRYPAAQLFMERAAASGYRSELSDADAPIVARICCRLDGIELAASRVGSHGIRGTAELLDNRFKLLWHGRRTALPRHQTLNAMLDWSHNLLSEHERIVLCRLSVFVGDFTLQAACSVTSETEAATAAVPGAVACSRTPRVRRLLQRRKQ